MYFANFNFLWFLPLALLPLVIHFLTRSKPKRILFSNIRFLKTLDLEQKNIDRLTQFLVLLFRTLFIVALVMAFAQPIKKSDSSSQYDFISVYIDNSASMETSANGVSDFNLAKSFATTLLNTIDPSVQAHLWATSKSAQQFGVKTPSALAKQIGQMDIDPQSFNSNDVLQNFAEYINGLDVKPKKPLLVLLSDLRATDSLPDSLSFPYQLVVVPVGQGLYANIYVDSVWLSMPVVANPDGSKLSVRLESSGLTAPKETLVRFMADGNQVASATVTVEPNKRTQIDFPVPALKGNPLVCQITTDDKPVVHDNTFFFVIPDVEKSKVAVVCSEEVRPQFEALFSNSDLFELYVSDGRNVDYTQLTDADLLVYAQLSSLSAGLTQQLDKHLSSGKRAVFIPSENGDLPSNLPLNIFPINNNERQARKVLSPQPNDPFFSGVFEKRIPPSPVATSVALFDIPNGFRKILTYEDGKVFVGQKQIGKGYLTLFSGTVLNKNEGFATDALFVPLFYKLSAEAANKSERLFYRASEVNQIVVKNSKNITEKNFRLTHSQLQTQYAPAIQIGANRTVLTIEAIGQIGVYNITANDSVVGKVAFNPSATESVTNRTLTTKKQSNQIKVLDPITELSMATDVASSMVDSEKSGRLFTLFLLIAIIFVLAEMLVLAYQARKIK